MSEGTATVKDLAREARKRVTEMIWKAQTSHIGSNLSCIDIMAVLFSRHIRLDNRMLPDRDRFVLSKGWAAASLYYFLAYKSVIPWTDLDKYNADDSEYLGLAEPRVRGVEAAGGAMGHGLPMAVGMALAGKREGSKRHVYCLMSDGEVACGTTWESMLIAAHQGLGNLTVIIDYNKLQAMGRTNEVVNLEPLTDKFLAMGWVVQNVDGHDTGDLELAFNNAANGVHVPTVIIAHTVKGKGVSFMEDKVEWHYKNISDEEYALAEAEL